MELDQLDFLTDDDVKAKIIEISHSELATLNDGISTKIEEATDGLKRSKAAILDEKKQLEKKWEGVNFDEVKDAVAFYTKNKDSKIIETGKLDELVESKVSQLRSDHEAEIGEVQTALDDSTKVGKTFQTLYETKIMEDTIRDAAVAAKVIPEAIGDVIARANSVFSLGEEFKVEARDGNGDLLKTSNGIIVTPSNWMETLKDSAPHYWPASEGAGLGGKGGESGTSTDKLNHLATTNHAAFVAARRKQMQSR